MIGLEVLHYKYDAVDRLVDEVRFSHQSPFDPPQTKARGNFNAAFSYTREQKYDDIDRLLNDGSNIYNPDKTGNHKSNPVGGNVQPGNRVEATKDWKDILYDDEGNLTQKTKVKQGFETWFYTYDHANRLTRAELRVNKDPNSLLLESADYTYDVFGQVIKRDARPRDLPPEVETYVYDLNGKVRLDLDTDNQVKARYMRGNGEGLLEGRIDPQQGNVFRYVTDLRGSVISVIDKNADIVKRRRYGGFGALPNPKGAVTRETIKDRYEYAGMEFDRVTGLQQKGGRWYDPQSGRWQTEDPRGLLGGGVNLYRFKTSEPHEPKPTEEYLKPEQPGFSFDLEAAAVGCVGGIVPGAAGGALVGSAAPIVGTGAGAIIGAVGGCIGGGLAAGIASGVHQQAGLGKLSAADALAFGVLGGAVTGPASALAWGAVATLGVAGTLTVSGTGAGIGLTYNASRQLLLMHVDNDPRSFDWQEFWFSGLTAAVAAPVLVAFPLLAISGLPVQTYLSVMSGLEEYEKGHTATAFFDIGAGVLPTAYLGARAAIGAGRSLYQSGILGRVGRAVGREMAATLASAYERPFSPVGVLLRNLTQSSFLEFGGGFNPFTGGGAARNFGRIPLRVINQTAVGRAARNEVNIGRSWRAYRAPQESSQWLRYDKLDPRERPFVMGVLAQLGQLAQQAVQSAGRGRGYWATELKNTLSTSEEYARVRGLAIHEKFFGLVKQQRRAGNLPWNLTVNRGVELGGIGLPFRYQGASGVLRPDVRLALPVGGEAVFDLTSLLQASASKGHVGTYVRFPQVRYAVDIPY